MTSEATIRYKPGQPLPPFRPVDDAIRQALPALAPPKRITVSEAATQRRIDAGGRWAMWSNDVAPAMVEPMDLITSRQYEAVVFVGPARSSKTEALILNPLAHTIIAAPRLAHVVHMSQTSAREFSIEALAKMIRHSPELAERVAPGRSSDNLFDKRFIGGARITIGWPVVQQLSARTIPLVLITDYDRMPSDVDGEGSVFSLGRKRTQSVGSRGMTVAESSPGFPILDEDWRQETAHEAPPCEGILALYNLGTRARRYWRCPECHGEFRPEFATLRYPEDGTPAERGAAAYMACPHCGGVIPPEAKRALDRAGRWLHEGADGKPAPLDAARPTAIASFWLEGPAAPLAPWSQIVTRYLEATETFETTGDETALKACVNVDIGRPYLPQVSTVSMGLTEQALKESASAHEWGVCPAATCFVTVAVDVQIGRFVVQVEAWRAGLERVVIDRFDLHTPPETAPRADTRRIDPGRYAEDWAVLEKLAGHSWPVAGAEHRLRAVAVVIDASGAPGVTPNAYAFSRGASAVRPDDCH